MYSSIRAQNFRVFKDFQLDNLARLNLVSGMNSSGKTSLLEAIMLYSGQFSAELLLRKYLVETRRSRATSSVVRAQSSWDILFNNFDTSQDLVLSATSEDGNREFLPGFEEEMKAVTLSVVKPSELDAELFLTLVRRLGPLSIREEYEDIVPVAPVLQIEYLSSTYSIMRIDTRLIYDRLPSPNKSVAFLPARRRVSDEENTVRFSNLRLEGRQRILVEALQIIEPRLEDLEIVFDTIHAELGLKKLVPLNVLGEGIGRVTSLILALSDARNGIVAVDEIENGLYYSTLVEVWHAVAKAAREFNVQLFATTHSFECIRAAHDAFYGSEQDDFRYHRLDRQPDGQIRPVTYQPDVLQAGLEMDWEVR